jgi:DNA mismatch endonuclease (patch repair protein)
VTNLDSEVDPARSALMRKIKGKNTKPELVVRRALHAMGLRFRLHSPNLPGRPDIVLPRHRVAIFVHGCFWHRHSGCKKSTSPRTRAEFWREKFEQNIARDARNVDGLVAYGWRPIVIWECETKNSDDLVRRIVDAGVLRSRE